MVASFSNHVPGYHTDSTNTFFESNWILGTGLGGGILATYGTHGSPVLYILTIHAVKTKRNY